MEQFLIQLKGFKWRIAEIGQINCCGVEQKGEYPAPVTYGAGIRALLALLSIDHKMPLEPISQLFEQMYGLLLLS